VHASYVASENAQNTTRSIAVGFRQRSARVLSWLHVKERSRSPNPGFKSNTIALFGMLSQQSRHIDDQRARSVPPRREDGDDIPPIRWPLNFGSEQGRVPNSASQIGFVQVLSGSSRRVWRICFGSSARPTVKTRPWNCPCLAVERQDFSDGLKKATTRTMSGWTRPGNPIMVKSGLDWCFHIHAPGGAKTPGP